MSDNEVAELMQRSDPARDVHDRRTETQLAKDLLSITTTLTEPASKPVPHPRRTIATVLTLTAVITASVALVAIWTPHVVPEPATPPLLEVAPTNQTLDEVLGLAMEHLGSSADVVAQRGASSEVWHLETQVDDQLASNQIITPQIRKSVWDDDLSGTVIRTSGRSYSPTASQYSSQGSPPEALAPKPGTVLGFDEFGPGEMPVSFPASPPTDAMQMRVYLTGPQAQDRHTTDAVAYFRMIRTLLNEWTLGPKGEVALLQFLSDTKQFTIAGDVTDRLGRQGTALRAISQTDSHFEYLLIIGSDTGRVIAAERIYVGGLPNYNVTGPAVIDYTAWK